MPNHDFQHQKRDREFYTRLLMALEKPKQNKLLSIINSAFFLWLMSLIILTMGGSYLTAYQQCTKDALDEIALDVKIQREYVERELHIQEIVATDSTIASMRASLANSYTYHPEFKDYPTKVIREQYKLRKDRMIDVGENPSLGSSSNENLLTRIIISSKFAPIEDGILPTDLTDSDIPQLRQFAAAIKNDLPKESSFWLLFADTTLSQTAQFQASGIVLFTAIRPGLSKVHPMNNGVSAALP